MKKLLFYLMFMTLYTLSCTDSPKLNLLIVTGGHGFERDAFFSIFNSFSDIDYEEVVHPHANTLYAAQEIDNYDVLVFYDMVQDISEEQKEAFINLLNRGKGIVFLHHSLVSYQAWDEFEKIIGGRYYLKSDSLENTDIIPSNYKHDVIIPVEIEDKNHPITEGLSSFEIHDEVYGNYKVLPIVHSLLSTTHPESGDIVAWTNEYGKSRIVYIQLGHDHFAYENPNFRRLVHQAIKWVHER
jgi:type 1 glutamine amidotransferase